MLGWDCSEVLGLLGGSCVFLKFFCLLESLVGILRIDLGVLELG